MASLTCLRGCAGNVFLKFCKLLHIKLDPIDPSLYIHRFASMLEFADKTQQVPISHMLALRKIDYSRHRASMLEFADRTQQVPIFFFFFFITLGLELSDTNVYAP